MLYIPQMKGQGLVEYTFILVLVSTFVIVLISIFGPQIGNVFSNIIDRL